MIKKNGKGFTIIELLVVIGIIGILATVAVAMFKNSMANARNQKRKADLKMLARALETYLSEHGSYPSTGGNWWGNTSVWGNHPDSGTTSNTWIPYLTPNYIPVLPDDPTHNKVNSGQTGTCSTSPGHNAYLYNSNGADYKLIALCTPEGTWPSSDPFYDPQRGNWAFAIFTPGGAGL